MTPNPKAPAIRILVVEDEGDISEPLAEVLREEGHVVTLAPDGAEAMDRLESQPFDLVLLDLRLPKVDGLTVARRAAKRQPSAQVILMSAYSSVPGGPPGIEYLRKPFDLEALLARIAALAQPLKAQAP